MRTISLEEHYATPAFMDGPGHQIKEEAAEARAHPQVAAGLARLIEQLCDIGEGRIANMDAAGLDLQVRSLTFRGDDHLRFRSAAVTSSRALPASRNPGLALTRMRRDRLHATLGRREEGVGRAGGQTPPGGWPRRLRKMNS
jgi:hypothetical protein